MLLVGCELAHFLFQLVELFLEPRRLEHEHVGRFLPIRRIELGEIPRHTLLELRAPAIDLPSCKIAIAIIDRFELAAVDGYACLCEQAYLPTQLDEARAHLAYRRAIVLAEIRNRLVIGNQPARQPQDLDIATSLTLKPAARLHPVEIAVDVKLQKNRGVVGRPACRCRLDAFEAEISQIERVDKAINYTNRIALLDPLSFWQQRRLSAIGTLNEALHESPPGKSPSES